MRVLFGENVCENERTGSRREARRKFLYVDPPMQAKTTCSLFYLLTILCMKPNLSRGTSGSIITLACSFCQLFILWTQRSRIMVLFTNFTKCSKAVRLHLFYHNLNEMFLKLSKWIPVICLLGSP